MGYEIEFTRAALKAFDKLQAKEQRRISGLLGEMERNPAPIGSRRITGSQNLLRARVGDYRVVYQVEEERSTILIVRIGHRREVYRGL